MLDLNSDYICHIGFCRCEAFPTKDVLINPVRPCRAIFDINRHVKCIQKAVNY